MRNNLDLLRAFAVTAVLICHTLKTAFRVDALGPLDAHKIGYAGVIAFFVHTSCVLMMSLDRLTANGGTWGDFYVRRAFRLYPLAIVATLCTVALHIPASPQNQYIPYSGADIAANLLLIQNLVYAAPIPGQLWSLPLEMQMYIVLPMLWWVSRRRTAWLKWVGVLAVGAALAQPAISGRVNVLYYAPCFTAGVIAYTRLRRSGMGLHWALWPALILVAYVAFACVSRYENVALWAFAAALGFALPHFRDLPHGVASRIFAWIAKYSYGIYLTHAACLYFCFNAGANLPGVVKWVGFAVLVGGASVGAYHLIEQPCIDFGVRLTTRRRRVLAQTAVAYGD